MTEPSRSRRRRESRGFVWLGSGRGALTAIVVVVAIVVAAAGLSIALSGGIPPDRSAVAPSVPALRAVSTGGPTTETSVSPIVTDSVAPAPGSSAARGIRAKHVQIQRLGIDLRIVDGDGIDAPIGKAAHYPGSGWPDGGTNIYIYAHARTGMFLSLWDARVGDRVVLTLVDGTQRTYVVDEVLPKVPWDALQYLAPTPAEQLTLQTSTSYYGTAPRFVVIAHPSP
jgi:LPXTG-site transpeptidase (sortase) family protein